MAVLLSCWFIIESVIIPGGLRKWFCLSFYIHPIFLLCCPIFLWLVLLKRVILALLCYVIEAICFLGSCVLTFFRFCFTNLFVLTKVTTNIEVVESLQVVENRNQIVDSCVGLGKELIVLEVQVLKLCQVGRYEDSINYGEDDKEQSFDTKCLSDVLESCSPTKIVDTIINQMEPSSSLCSSSSSPISVVNDDHEMDESLQAIIDYDHDHDHHDEQQDIEESDPFYEMYEDRMKWFDILSQERRCGISAILRNQVETPMGQMARKRVLKSLESDIELVYVAQSCLSWEALNHQYRKVEFLASRGGSQEGVFYNNVAGEFQNFQILLERFLEEERCQGDRVWNYVQGRSSLKSFLQVPAVSGFSEMKMDGRRGEAKSVKEVLKIIEQCIKAYWEFVKVDMKKSWWSSKTSPWTIPSVEDPRDLVLLADLTNNLQRKEQEVKDLWAKKMKKKKSWLKRGARHVEECEGMEKLLAMIDVKLIRRVLQMSIVSSSNLRWCQEKLQLVEVKEGRVFRAWPGPMFPP